jgi:hypothetical protein
LFKGTPNRYAVCLPLTPALGPALYPLRPPRLRQTMTLYKFRDFSNIERTLDILVNSRMYAAKFTTLNDPMEGHYRYAPGALTHEETEAIFSQKSEYGILSLSESYNNLLLWSYYAASNTGIAIGVEVCDEQSDITKIRYVKEVKVLRHTANTAKGILSRKINLWAHEKEHRVFKRGDPFVKVHVREVIFGLQTERTTKELVTAIAQKFCPDARIWTIRRNDLESSIGN